VSSSIKALLGFACARDISEDAVPTLNLPDTHEETKTLTEKGTLTLSNNRSNGPKRFDDHCIFLCISEFPILNLAII
jgi:hypothetical protein